AGIRFRKDMGSLGRSHQKLRRILSTSNFLVGEKEQFILYDRKTDAEACLVVVEIAVHPTQVAYPVVTREAVITAETVNGTLDLIGALTRDGIDRSSSEVTYLHVVGRQVHLHVLYGIQGDGVGARRAPGHTGGTGLSAECG